MDDKEFRTKVIEKLDLLTEAVKELTKLIAISSSVDTELKDKKKGEKIKILSDLGLSRETVAFIVGSTTDSVYSTLSQIRRKEQDELKAKESKENVQPSD